MGTVTLTATKRSNLSVMDSPQVKTAQLNVHEWTVEVGSSDSSGSTYHIAHLPTNARISGLSWIGYDDLASTGAPTIDIGTFNFADGTSDDPDSINDGLTVATADATRPFLGDMADNGLHLWEIGTSPTSDPGGFIDIKLTLADANVNVGGTISGSIVYKID